ncbi:MAG TPA: ABC transporter ATP-binding protein [Actinomycetes bacterium]|nr:ABC transporter ATP-binding protein [Actinomycetes bacterium]
MFAARIELRIGSLDIDVAVDAADGETVALLGPNGAGKTTILRAIAGLLAIERGRIEVDGLVLDDPAAGVFVPTADRPIGLVFQDYLLFPRMSALDNVAFGLRARGMDKPAARAAAAGWLERFGLTGHAASRPRALSGGQSQRVALARALATSPRLLLLDEPLAALDAGTRVQVRTSLRRYLATFGGARILVTHDPVDAMVLADRVIVVEDGRVIQAGTVTDVARHPRSRYVADLVGVNLLHGTRAEPYLVRLASGAELVVADPLPGDEVVVAVRPQAVAVYRDRPDGSPRNVWPATVADVEVDRDRVRVQLEGPVPVVAEVTPGALAELELAPGTRVWAAVKAVELSVYTQ